MVAVQASSHIDPTHRYTATLSSADKRLVITKMRATRRDGRHNALGGGPWPGLLLHEAKRRAVGGHVLP